jgi:site-specific DNA recombinase
MGSRTAPRQRSNAPTRAAAYHRVSSDEQVEGYSLDAEMRATRAYSEGEAWEIVQVYADEGRSARTDDLAKRPAFAHMLDDAEAGRFDLIIVHKLDRFSRNRKIAFKAFERLGRAGVSFLSIAENMDYTSPAGQLMLTMLVGMSQFYSDNLSFETKKGKQERKRQGLYNGLLPFGVTKGSNDIPILDSEVRSCAAVTRSEIVPANGLLLVCTSAAEGKTDVEVARALNAAGYRTIGNRGLNPFTNDEVRPLLQNRFYLGDLPDGAGGWRPGKHGALIDPDLFERAARERARNLKRPRRVAGVRSPWALSGLATCVCGRPMTAYGRQDGKQRVQCSGRTQGLGCTAATFFGSLVEEQIATFLQENFAIPAAERDRLVREWQATRRTTSDSAAARHRFQGKLDRLKTLFVEGDVDLREYQRQRAELQAQLAALPEDDRLDQATGRRLADLLADVAGAWQLATPAERNKLARQLFNGVVIENKTTVAVVPRPDLHPFVAAAACQADPEMTFRRKRRGLDERLRQLPPGSVLIFDPSMGDGATIVSQPARLTSPVRKLSPETERQIVALAARKSLRSLAADFGVSHETIRSIIKRHAA